MRRRVFLAAIAGVTLLPSTAVSLEAKPIGVLGTGAPDAQLSIDQIKWLREGLHETGLVEGRDFIIHARWPSGDYTRLPVLATELLAVSPGAIVVSTIAAAQVVQKLSKTVPIVMTGLNDPVAYGLAASLSRPGGTITGMASMNELVTLKLLELLPLVLPRARSVAAMFNPSNPSNKPILNAVTAQAAQMGLAVSPVEIASAGALDLAFANLARQPPDVLLIIPDSALNTFVNGIVARALALRIPTSATFREGAEAGAILTYGYIRREVIKRAARFVAKILAGANPADLPIEQPTAFELVINRKTAANLGIEIPAATLTQADEVIE
jgi:putative ABC transport system substrate-binding protein